MNANISLDFIKDIGQDCDIYSDFEIDIEKPDEWEIIPTQRVKWTDSKDKRFTIYGEWTDSTHNQIQPIYKERKLGNNGGYLSTEYNVKSVDVKSINEKITPIEIHKKTIFGTKVISDGNIRIDIKTRNGNVYLKKN